jgi:DNA invertase Pin-like site-specific DNA recombinase
MRHGATLTTAKIGYARTSTLDQKAGLEAQESELRSAGCTKFFIEQVSSVDVTKRDQLDAALDYLRDGDTLVVTKLDRLARSTEHLMKLLAVIRGKGAELLILNLGIDTGTATGKLMLTVLSGIAEFEREIMLERQREGIAKAKAEGKYKGRKPTAQAKSDEITRLISGGLGATEIAKRLGIGRASVYRVRKE